MAQSWYSDPELLTTNFSVSYVCNNLSKAGDTVVRLSGSTTSLPVCSA